MSLPGSKRQRQKARRLLTISLTHPSGIFRVTGGRRAHEVVVSASGRDFVYRCDDDRCPGGPICSHILAVMLHMEPEKLSAPTK